MSRTMSAEQRAMMIGATPKRRGGAREGEPRPAGLAACDGRLLSEIRMPLSSIHAALELALAGSGELLRAEDREMLEIAVRSSERLTTVLDGVLEVPSLGGPSCPAAFGAAIVSKLLDEAERAMQPMAISRAVTLDAACEPDLPPLDASHAGLARVLTTLLANAIGSSPRGGRVTLSAVRLGSFVEFSVADSGPGLAADQADGLFMPSMVGGGAAGLGLAVCRTIVEQHGGRIWAEAAVPRGCRLAFVIPSAPAGSADARGRAAGTAS